MKRKYSSSSIIIENNNKPNIQEVLQLAPPTKTKINKITNNKIEFVKKKQLIYSILDNLPRICINNERKCFPTAVLPLLQLSQERELCFPLFKEKKCNGCNFWCCSDEPHLLKNEGLFLKIGPNMHFKDIIKIIGNFMSQFEKFTDRLRIEKYGGYRSLREDAKANLEKFAEKYKLKQLKNLVFESLKLSPKVPGCGRISTPELFLSKYYTLKYPNSFGI